MSTRTHVEESCPGFIEDITERRNRLGERPCRRCGGSEWGHARGGGAGLETTIADVLDAWEHIKAGGGAHHLNTEARRHMDSCVDILDAHRAAQDDLVVSP